MLRQRYNLTFQRDINTSTTGISFVLEIVLYCHLAIIRRITTFNSPNLVNIAVAMNDGFCFIAFQVIQQRNRCRVVFTFFQQYRISPALNRSKWMTFSRRDNFTIT